MITLSKALTGTVAAVAVAVSGTASAQDRGIGDRSRGERGISAGDIVAGAVVLGGIAAVASATGRRGYDRDYGYDRAGYRSGYGRHHGWRDDDPREAIQRCASAVQYEARRGGYDRVEITDIRDIDRTRWGYEVRGRIAVRGGDRGWHGGWRGASYDRDDDRGWNRDYDNGSFRCKVEQGRIADLDFSGIRGL